MTWLKTVAIVAVVFTLGYCSGHAVAAPFTSEDDAYFQQALTYWNVTEVPDCTVITKEVVAHLEVEGVVAGGDATQTYPGYLAPCVLNINSDDPPCALEHIFEHEVGHLLEHTHAEGGVMEPTWDYTTVCPQEVARERAEIRAQVRKESTEINQVMRRWRKHHVIRGQNL